MRKIINLFLVVVLIFLLVFFVWRHTSLSAGYYYNKGKQLYNAQKYEEALDMFEQASVISPANEAYKYYYAVVLTKLEPTYYVQEKLYLMANSKDSPQSVKNLLRPYISQLKKEFLDGLESNYIFNAISSKEIIHWNLEDFPIKVYIQKNSNIPESYIVNILNALKQWEDRSGFIAFKQVETEKESNISILFEDLPKNNCNEQGCKYIVATTQHSEKSGMLEKMTIIFYKTNPYGENFLDDEIKHTALHELGHALGIMGHSSNKSDIMYTNNDRIYDFFAQYRPKNLNISFNDIKTITLLYKIFPTLTNSRIMNKDKYIYAPIILGADDELLLKKLEEFKNYIVQYPDITTGYINISTIYAQLGEYEKGLEALETARELIHDNNERYLIEYNTAVICFNMQEFEKSKKHANKALNIKYDENLENLIKEIENIEK